MRARRKSRGKGDGLVGIVDAFFFENLTVELEGCLGDRDGDTTHDGVVRLTTVSRHHRFTWDFLGDFKSGF